MSTVMPQTELLRKALKWVSSTIEEKGGSLETVIEQASMRFNLSPKDSLFLKKIFEENSVSHSKIDISA